jgi:uncharacterized protein YdhG (YjbR/CyaY superfamily)
MNEAINAYLANQPNPQSETLTHLRATIARLVPHATEQMSYGMPAFALGGKAIVGYAGFKNHCAYFPMSGSVLDRAGDAIDGFDTSKGGLRFDIGTRLPTKLIRRLLDLRIEELSDVKNGRRTDYFADGGLKATGSVKAGELHGAWTWFRKDGSTLRTGSFRAGAQIGEWTTYDREGNAVKTTRFGP